MLFLQSKDAGNSNCMGDYVNETHRCLATYSKKPAVYNDCLTMATNTLEACALEELILDTDALHHYDVDNTAYMSLKQVLSAQKEMQHLINAADHTYVKWSKIKMGEPKAKTFKKYKETFMAEKKSIDLEVEITKLRLMIDDVAEKMAESEECHKGNNEEVSKLRKLYERIHEEWTQATKEASEMKATCGGYEVDVTEIEHKIEKLTIELTECETAIKKLQTDAETLVGSMKNEENMLLKLIKERKVQPKTRLQKGWKVSCWIARRKNGRGFSNEDYEKFDFEKEKPDGELVTKKGQFTKGFALRNANEIKNFCGPMMNVAKMSKRRFHNGRRYEGHETLIRVKGVFIAPKTGTLNFHTNTDDGSYLWLGDFRTNKMIDNGGMHGMRIRDSQMPAKKGEHLPFIFTFYEHHGHGAAYLTAKMGKTVLAPYHYDNRVKKLLGLRKMVKKTRVSKGTKVVFKSRK